MSAPTVLSVSPLAGPLAGGTSVTITGADLGVTGTTTVTFGGTPATSVTVTDGSSISCLTPGHISGAVSVVVATTDGSVTADDVFTYRAAPTVTSASPGSGSSAGGTSVTISGNNFTGATGVTFGDTAATLVSVTNTSIVCTTQASSVGPASIVVTTPGGSNAANSLFSYVPPPPVVESIDPETGSTLGGTLVTVNGSGFTGVSSVTIGGVPATNVHVVSTSVLTCISPGGSLVSVPVLVTAATGTSEPSSEFTYAALKPVVAHPPVDEDHPPTSGLSPTSGSAAGGTSVTITGKYFTGTTGVSFGGIAATHVAVIDDTSLTCITPAIAPGVVDVLVTTPNGHNDTSDYTKFTYVRELPAVASIFPSIGTSAGSTRVTISGSYFNGVLGVSIGGLPATSVQMVDEHTLTCTTPAGIAGPASVLVTTGTGTSGPNNLYLYVQSAPTDTYIYLKGGRGDGFVPLWTGAFYDEDRTERSEPYRNIFQTTAQTQVGGSSGSAGFGGSLTLPGIVTSLTNAANVYAGLAKLSYTSDTMSDEAAGTAPRQFVKSVTWRSYTSANGLVYQFRLADILGTGSQPRSE